MSLGVGAGFGVAALSCFGCVALIWLSLTSASMYYRVQARRAMDAFGGCGGWPPAAVLAALTVAASLMHPAPA